MSPNPAVLTWPRAVASGGAGSEYLTYSETFTGTTTRTFASLSFGAAASNRNIIVVAHSRAGGAVTGATIGGVTATVNATFTDGFARVAVFSAVVPSGTSGSVVVTYASSPERSTVGVWAAYGTLAYDSHGTNGAGKTVAITAPSDALVIAAMTQLALNDWTFTTPAEDYNAAVAGPMQYLGAHGEPPAGSYTVTVSSVATNYSNSALMAVAFTLT